MHGEQLSFYICGLKRHQYCIYAGYRERGTHTFSHKDELLEKEKYRKKSLLHFFPWGKRETLNQSLVSMKLPAFWVSNYFRLNLKTKSSTWMTSCLEPYDQYIHSFIQQQLLSAYYMPYCSRLWEQGSRAMKRLTQYSRIGT